MSSRFFLGLSLILHVYASAHLPEHHLQHLAVVSGPWSLEQRGLSGVSALQLAVVSETTAIIYDKVERNALTVDGHFAWAVEVDLVNATVRALNPLSNSFCATGSFLSNGTFVSIGGNPVVITGQNGLQAIRLFDPCSDRRCDVREWPRTLRITSPRWYPSSIRLEDGSILIYGGSTSGGYINSQRVNNPTYEFYPPKNINGFNGTRIPSQFLVDTLNGNQYPIMIYLPDSTIFIAANTRAMIFNWKTNTQTPLPDIPNGVRITSPFSAGATLLPLTPENNYTPEVLICGGSTLSDTIQPIAISAQAPASAQCSRLVLTTTGIAAGWQVETMPQPRLMPEIVLLPDGRSVIVNGAQSGVAGYGFIRNPVGQSNADNPAFTPVIYDAAAPAGSRFSSEDIPASPIPRMYHSSATLTPNGTILLAGSNPNDDVTTVHYPTEYRMEWYSPPYMTRPRPTYTGLPATVNYASTFTLTVDLPSTATNVSVSLMDLGFATHGVHMDQRLVTLVSSLSSDRRTLTVTGPPRAQIYPPGPGFLYVVTNEGVPSFGHKTIIGTGASPPVDRGAIANLLIQPLVDDVTPVQGDGSPIATAVIPVP